jgi:hypothetical protein
MRRRHKHDDTEIALANFSLTFAKALLVFCVVLFFLISPDDAKEEGLKPSMEFMIRLQWPEEIRSDVDIWIRDPDGKILYYGNRVVDFLSLERDDVGYYSEALLARSGTARMPGEEIVAIRGFKPGEYVVNAHLYRYRSTPFGGSIPPFEVKLIIDKLNPRIKTIYSGTGTFTESREEIHILRFTLTREGEITNIIEGLPVKLRNLR